MKRIIIFFILEFIIFPKIFGLNLCFPEKYKKYESAFSKAYAQMIENKTQFEYKYYENMEDYIKSLSLYKCDVAMIEPALYDQYYEYMYKIYKLQNVNETLTNRMNDATDGPIYTELLKDLQVNDRYEIQAFPLFLDYGILYYREDLVKNPPEKWNDLISVDEFKDNISYQVSNTIYVGQFNEYIEFFYNLFDNVLNTKDKLTNNVIERETKDTLKIFKDLFDKEIIDEYAWHLNSNDGVSRFNEGKALYMRNWSSYLYNVTVAYKDKSEKFKVTKVLYNGESKTANQSRAINKGIYICVANSIKEENLNEAILVAETFSSKEFMKLLIEDESNIFYDIPAYHSLINKNDENNVKNKKYCERINCDFFRELAEDHIIATYSVFHRKDLYRLSDFFEKAISFFKDSGDEKDASLDSTMKEFTEYLESNALSRFNSLSNILKLILIFAVYAILV